MDRLAKYISGCGICSRRSAEKLILENKVIVNNQVINNLSFKVKSDDIILVNGKKIEEQKKIYILFNKPYNVISKFDNKNSLSNFLLLDKNYKLYPLLNLRYDQAGLMLLSNDGILLDKFMKNRLKYNFLYQLRISGRLDQKTINKLKRGIIYLNNKYYVDILEYNYDKIHDSSLLKISLDISIKENILSFFTSNGLVVKKIKRLSFFGIDIKDLKEGYFRELKIHEIKKLYSM